MKDLRFGKKLDGVLKMIIILISEKQHLTLIHIDPGKEVLLCV
jgi:hypothetical protein